MLCWKSLKDTKLLKQKNGLIEIVFRHHPTVHSSLLNSVEPEAVLSRTKQLYNIVILLNKLAEKNKKNSMKTFILIFSILFVSIVVTLKLITSTEPLTSSEISRLKENRYGTEKEVYQNSSRSLYKQSIDTDITDHKLMAFAKAFVTVQSYMNQAGNKASYEETREIVKNHGLSVDEYTMIATRMNANPDFQSKVLRMIDDIN